MHVLKQSATQKTVAVFLICLCLLLAGAALAQPAKGETVNSTFSWETQVAPYDGMALQAYKAILQENASFYSAEGQQTITLKEQAEFLEGVTIVFPRFALNDLDGDGSPEMVLWESVNGTEDYGYLVLRHQADGVVTGYDLSYRALMELKEDGTFSYSSGALDNGIGSFLFSEAGYDIQPLSWCQPSSAAAGVDYFVNGQTATEAAYSAAVEQQAQKPGAVWYELAAAEGQANG